MKAVKGGPAVMLMAYGAAESTGELPGFLRDILRGPVSKESLARATERYIRIGGCSPLCAITRRQAQALQMRLNGGRGEAQTRVVAAFRHSKPSIHDALRELVEEGCTRLVALPMTPFASLAAASGYARELERAAKELDPGLDTEVVGDWHDHPGLIEAFAEKLREAMKGASPLASEETALVYVSHSLPERLLIHGDPYTRHFEDAARAVSDSTGFDEFSLAFLGRGEAGSWLGPEANEVLVALRKAGVRRVVLCPLGYLAENADTLYECDVECRGRARELGLELVRAAAPDDSATLVAALADLVRRAPVP